jgi:ribulose-5-phosphate 4-epimerase/fuculose-1-phosphate aldolase
MGVHFGMLKASDMVHINEDGQVIGGNRVAVNAAGFMIHSAIHKARPDVDAACHAHSKFGKAWSTFGKPLDIINQDACIFWNNQSVYSNFGGVVFEDQEGARIAEALGPKNRAVILQNHGLLTAGGTVDEAAYLFSLMERTCEVQLLVESSGLPKQIIGDEEAQYTYKYNADPVSFSYHDSLQNCVLIFLFRNLYTRSSSPTLSMRFGSPRESSSRVSRG